MSNEPEPTIGDVLVALVRMETAVCDAMARQLQMEENLKQLRLDLMARLGRLQNSMEPVSEQIWVNYSQVDAARRSVRLAEDQIRASEDQNSVLMGLILKLTERVRSLEEKQQQP